MTGEEGPVVTERPSGRWGGAGKFQAERPAWAKAYEPGSRENFPEELENTVGTGLSPALCVGRRGYRKEAAEAGPG